MTTREQIKAALNYNNEDIKDAEFLIHNNIQVEETKAALQILRTIGDLLSGDLEALKAVLPKEYVICSAGDYMQQRNGMKYHLDLTSLPEEEK